MEQNKFNAIMPMISADLIHMIVSKRDLSEQEAIKVLYASDVYSLLEQEDTKLWQYSTLMLYSLLEQELKTGKIEFPDV